MQKGDIVMWGKYTGVLWFQRGESWEVELRHYRGMDRVMREIRERDLIVQLSLFE